MHIVLLSGGSGKRLWPLSNDVRSKQFIKLFKDENGKDESMVQRVYRQLSKTIGCGITISTSKSQVSSINNQLGDSVSVCIEPCRRDTFPAISLVAAYLHDELKLYEKECIVVCPVDTYVEDSFFKKIIELENIIISGQANLVLMGIEPTCPSEKYGYIIPEDCEDVTSVKEFKEKPSEVVARKYIKQGALWNAGIFAFRLGFMLNKAHELIKFNDYTDLYKNYNKLIKISFDYAVVEKEDCLKVVRYKGEWKDVGTWNMMTDVMVETQKGNVIIDDICENTHVVNELDMPIVCMGCKNLIVAASSDGILISDKERSSYIKPYVEKLNDEIKFAEKSWGRYNVIHVAPCSITVKISLLPGHNMSYHSHRYRDEIWTVILGEGIITIDGKQQKFKTGDVITIAAGCKHSVAAITDMDIIEVQLGKNISVSDKIKYD